MRYFSIRDRGFVWKLFGITTLGTLLAPATTFAAEREVPPANSQKQTHGATFGDRPPTCAAHAIGCKGTGGSRATPAPAAKSESTANTEGKQPDTASAISSVGSANGGNRPGASAAAYAATGKVQAPMKNASKKIEHSGDPHEYVNGKSAKK